MCDTQELPWPPCDSAPFSSVSNKSCIIIKARSEYKIELKQLMANFGENYKRALALFYAKEAEQKAIKQNKLLTEYILQLQKYLQDIKVGVANAERPVAPLEVFPEDPLDSVEESYSGMVTIGSISIQSESSIDMEYVESKRLVSSETIEILKRRCSSSQSVQEVSSTRFSRRISKGSISNDISNQSLSHKTITKISERTLHLSNTSSKLEHSVEIVEKMLQSSSEKILKGQSDSKLPETLSNQLEPPNSENEVYVDSDDSSDLSISDYETAGEETSANPLIKEDTRAADDDREAVLPSKISRNQSTSSIASNETQFTDQDAVLEALQNQISDLNNKLNLSIEEQKGKLAERYPISEVKTPEDLRALIAEEQKLLEQISFMKSKLKQLDEVAAESIQLKDYCENLPTAMSPQTFEKLFGKSADINIPGINNALKYFPSEFEEKKSSQVNLMTGQPSQAYYTQNFNQASSTALPVTLAQEPFGSIVQSENGLTRSESLKAQEVSFLKNLLAHLIKKSNVSDKQTDSNMFSLPSTSATPQQSFKPEYEQIIGKLLHQEGNYGKTNFMRPVSVNEF